MGIYAERIFPWLLDRMLDQPAIHERRARLVGPASGDVLEIGFGTGATLPFYDRDRVRTLAVVEPSSGMNRRAMARIAESGWSVRVEPLGGESLPFAPASFDCVISSLTLCTVRDPRQVLAEVLRVLRPGGRLRFFEHVASCDPARRRWQDRLTPLQRVIGVGCHLNRETPALIRSAGFVLGEVAEQVVPQFGPTARWLPVVEAEAFKPAS